MLAGKKLLVTGGDSGIGLAFVRAAVADGAALRVIVREDSQSLDGIVDSDARFAADLADPASTTAAVAAAIESQGGTLDGLVSCAGVFLHEAALETSADDWNAVLDVNLRGAFLVARDAALAMRPTGRGAIVMVSSQIGEIGHPAAAAYAASKAGINGLVRSMALELASAGIRVNAVGPGPVETPMTAEALADPKRAGELVEQVPLGRLGQPEEIAAVIRFLLSDDASFITGQVVMADGGVTAA
jgi:NAD(P)-dependent dehydrogenase (short-subunit alcohol dehydrogenase family)